MKKLKSLLVIALFLVVSSIGMKAYAAPSTVTRVAQTGAGSNYVEIEWNALLDNDIRYEAAISTDGVHWVTKEDYPYTINDMRISNLNAGSSYKVRVRGYTCEWNDATGEYENTYGNYSAPIEVVTAPNQDPRNVKHVSSTANSITVSWSAVPGANSYVIEYANETSLNNTKKLTVTAPKVTINNLSKNSEYRVTIYPIRVATTGFKTNADWTARSTSYSVPVVPSGLKAPEIANYWQNLSEVGVSSPGTRCADGFQYEIQTSSGSKVTRVEDTSKYTAFIKKSTLKKHKVFRIRVKGYINLNGGSKKVYGSWSSWRYFAPQPDIVKISKVKSTGKLRVKWDTIDGSSRYVLYGSTKKDSGYKKITATRKTSYDVSKVRGSKLKKNRTYYFKVVAQKKVGKKYLSLDTGNADTVWYVKY